jgi:hypothetical protein
MTRGPAGAAGEPLPAALEGDAGGWDEEPVGAEEGALLGLPGETPAEGDGEGEAPAEGDGEREAPAEGEPVAMLPAPPLEWERR